LSNDRHHLGVTELQDLIETGGSATVAQHLADCTECRIRAARLARTTGVPSPSSSTLDRILTSDTRLSPEIAGASRAYPQATSPTAGELWRVGEGDVLLVWVRRVLDGAADVIPVVLDVDLADDHTLLLPASSTTLGLDLGLVTSVRGHVHLDAFLSRVDTLDATVADQVSEVMQATNDRRAPSGVSVGTPVYDPDDQRVEFQQTVADLLADFGPGTWNDGQQMDQAQASVDAELLELLKAELIERHPCQVQPSLPVVASLHAGSMLRAVARVSYANAVVIVAVLPRWQDENFTDVASACRSIVRQEPGSVAVAVCDYDQERLTLVVEAHSMSDAYEAPGGLLQPPHPSREPMSVIDALHKYLDTSAPAWEAVDSARNLMATDLSAAILTAAEAAVAGVLAQGASARTPAKKEAWRSLSTTTADRIAAMLEQVVAGAASAAAVDRFLEGGQG